MPSVALPSKPGWTGTWRFGFRTASLLSIRPSPTAGDDSRVAQLPGDLRCRLLTGFSLPPPCTTTLRWLRGTPNISKLPASLSLIPGHAERYLPALYTTKYFAPGWWTTIADVDCSGSRRNPVVRRTPIFSSGWSRANSLVWSSRFGHAG